MARTRSIRSTASRQVGRSASPTGTATTRASELPLGPDIIISRTNLHASLECYERLCSAAKAYRNAMIALSTATNGFAFALEECARQKGATSHPEPDTRHTSPTTNEEEDSEERSPAELLMAAAGLHHLMGNNQQVLSDTFYKFFEIPLLDHYDQYKAQVAERQAIYEQALAEKSSKIRETEAENLRVGRKKQRDLSSFRKALTMLQAQVDELDRVKADHYTEVLAGEQETWATVANKTGLVIRSTIDYADRVATKGSTDAVLETMVNANPDLFGVYGPPKTDSEIFSILPPLSILSPSQQLSRSSNVTPSLSRGPSDYSAKNGITEWAKRAAGANTFGDDEEDEATPQNTPSKADRRNGNLSQIYEGVENEWNDVAKVDASDTTEAEETELPESREESNNGEDDV